MKLLDACYTYEKREAIKKEKAHEEKWIESWDAWN